jgi:hypothetical protein
MSVMLRGFAHQGPLIFKRKFAKTFPLWKDIHEEEATSLRR